LQKVQNNLFNRVTCFINRGFAGDFQKNQHSGTQNHANNTNTQPHSICRNGWTKLAFRATAFSFVPTVTNTDARCTQMAPCNVTVFIGAIVLVTFRFVACLREIRQFMRGVVQFIRTICVGSFQFVMARVWFAMAGMGVKTFLKGTGGLQRFLIGVCVEAIWWPFRCIVYTPPPVFRGDLFPSDWTFTRRTKRTTRTKWNGG
jgi:hypothetical protein